jgi:hypothetical protein
VKSKISHSLALLRNDKIKGSLYAGASRTGKANKKQVRNEIEEKDTLPGDSGQGFCRKPGQ